MISTNKHLDDGRPSAGASFNRSVHQWATEPVPANFWDMASTTAHLTFHDLITSGLWSKFVSRDDDIQVLKDASPRMQEVLTPEQIALEFPNTQEPIKTPRTRAEMTVLEMEDISRANMMAGISGKYTSMIPSIIPSLGGSLAGSIADPTTILMGFGSIGLISKIPAMRKFATMANFGKSMIERRGAAAAIGATEGFVGGALYSLANMPLQRSLDRTYKWGRVAEEALYSSGFGGALGMTIPQTAQLISMFDTHKGTGLPVFLANLHMMRQLLNSKDALRRFWADESGAIDLTGLADFLNGRQTKARKPILDSIRRVVTKETAPDFPSSSSPLEGLFKYEFQEQQVLGQFKATLKGVNRFQGFKYRSPVPFYQGLYPDGNIQPHFTTKPENKVQNFVQYGNAYIAIPEAPRKGRQGTITLTDNIRGAVHHELVKRSAAKSGTPNVRAMEVSLRVGRDRYGEAANFFNLDSDDFALHFNNHRGRMTHELVKGLEIKDGAKFADLSESKKGKVQRAIMSHPLFDGYVYADTVSKSRTMEMKRSSLHKVNGFSDNFKEFELAPDEKITSQSADYFIKALEQKLDSSTPPPVRDFLQTYYKDWEATGDTSFFDKYLRRIHPNEVKVLNSLGRTAKIDAPFTLEDGRPLSFNSNSNFFRLPQQVWQDTIDILKSMDIDTNIDVRIESFDHLIDVVLGGRTTKKKLVDPFFKKMREKGYKFPDTISLFEVPGKWFLLSDRVIEPIPHGETVISTMMGGRAKDFEGTKILLKNKGIDLGLNPTQMLDEEIRLLKSLVNDDVKLDIDPVLNTLTFQAGDAAKVTGLLNKANPFLKAMGITEVAYRTPKGVMKHKIFTPTTKDIEVDAKKYIESFNELEMTPEPTAKPEGQIKTEGGEVKKAEVKYLSELAGLGPTRGNIRILRTLRDNVATPQQKEFLDKLESDYRDLVRAFEETDPQPQGLQGVCGQEGRDGRGHSQDLRDCYLGAGGRA